MRKQVKAGDDEDLQEVQDVDRVAEVDHMCLEEVMYAIIAIKKAIMLENVEKNSERDEDTVVEEVMDLQIHESPMDDALYATSEDTKKLTVLKGAEAMVADAAVSMIVGDQDLIILEADHEGDQEAFLDLLHVHAIPRIKNHIGNQAQSTQMNQGHHKGESILQRIDLIGNLLVIAEVRVGSIMQINTKAIMNEGGRDHTQGVPHRIPIGNAKVVQIKEVGVIRNLDHRTHLAHLVQSQDHLNKRIAKAIKNDSPLSIPMENLRILRRVVAAGHRTRKIRGLLAQFRKPIRIQKKIMIQG